MLLNYINIEDSQIFKKLQAKNGTDLHKELRQVLIHTYAEVFSKEELIELMHFYNSPVGKVFTSKNDFVMEKLMKQLPTIIMRHNIRIKRDKK